jgi:periplasmic divalent cation tolerance protein
MVTDCIEVRTTTDSREAAQKIAEALASQRLAACVQISGPITSTYWWEGKVSQAEEWAISAKTQRTLYDRLEQIIKQLHSYDEPEIIAVEIVTGSQSYLDWIRQETQ